MFSFFKKKFGAKPPAPAEAAPAPAPAPEEGGFDIPMRPFGEASPTGSSTFDIPINADLVQIEMPPPEPAVRARWIEKLRAGLQKTGSSLTQVFSRTTIDDELYDELEEALLMADAGVKATQFLLDDLKRRVREARVTEPPAVRGLLIDAIADLLKPLQKSLAKEKGGEVSDAAGPCCS